MTDEQAREIVLEAVDSASIGGIREHPSLPGFRQGAEDILLSGLDVDSLAAMEFCISIELATGLSISPDEIFTVDSLLTFSDLVRKGAM